MSGMGDDEEEYYGTVTAVFDETEVTVTAHLAGHFDPLSGEYRWTGRLVADPELDRLFRQGQRAVLLRTPEGYAGKGELVEVNVWGGYRVRGRGRPPFAVPELSAEEI